MELAPGERIGWSAPPELPGATILRADNSARRWHQVEVRIARARDLLRAGTAPADAAAQRAVAS